MIGQNWKDIISTAQEIIKIPMDRKKAEELYTKNVFKYIEIKTQIAIIPYEQKQNIFDMKEDILWANLINQLEILCIREMKNKNLYTSL